MMIAGILVFSLLYHTPAHAQGLTPIDIFDKDRESPNPRQPSPTPKIPKANPNDPRVIQAFAKAKQIMLRLQQQSSVLRPLHISLYRHDDMIFIAYSTGKSLHLSIKTLDVMRPNPNWLPIVIGHELSHIAHGDTGLSISRAIFCNSSNKHSRQCEKQADISGVDLANKAGYDGCQAESLWHYMFKLYGDDPNPDSTHPRDLERANYLKCR